MSSKLIQVKVSKTVSDTFVLYVNEDENTKEKLNKLKVDKTKIETEAKKAMATLPKTTADPNIVIDGSETIIIGTEKTTDDLLITPDDFGIAGLDLDDDDEELIF